MNLTIRNESSADIAAIEALTIAAFQDMQYSSHTEQFIINALRKAGQLSISLVAEVEGRIVGHVAVSPVVISDGSKGWYGLGPISVAPEYQGQGIGSQLMMQVLAELKQLGAAGCVLVGEPLYYGRFGFKAEPNLVYAGIPPEYFQALSFGSQIPVGEVTFHEAFNAQS